MLVSLIRNSLNHKLLVVLICCTLAGLGYQSLKTLPLDAIPDLSDVQVIVKTSYAGQASEIVEQQVTYPLSTWLMSVPKAKTVRGVSFFGDSFIYIIFEDGTDPYWARSRVQEYLSRASTLLPKEASPTLGPDASGVGWIFQYAIKDTSNQYNLSELRAVQDWFLKYELQSVQGVSEVATIGGMEQTYQVILEPLKLMQHGLTVNQVKQAIENANKEIGGSVVEMAEAEYMVRGRGYLSSIEDFEQIALGITSQQGAPLTLAHIARITKGPQMRRGIAELNGLGEVVGGIVVMRHGENALSTIEKVKEKLERLKPSLPDGLELEVVYDRSKLIMSSIQNLNSKIIQEMCVVALVCFAFLLHIRSTFIVIVSIPFSLLIGFFAMQWAGVNANIMSLGGIAIAIGALVDSAIVMVENLNRHLTLYQSEHGKPPEGQARLKLIQHATIEVGPALFVSLLLITLSFFPVFALEGQEGKLFTPLAITKTFVMAATALLSVTLIPVLMGLLMKGKMPSESSNPLNKCFITLYRPLIDYTLKSPKMVIAAGLVVIVSMAYPISQLDSEFMPAMNEGDLLYMPTTLPGVSIHEAGEILQKTDLLIKSLPEVHSVFGKVGRADTATDPAPLTMLETTIQLKPESAWREGMTLENIIDELENTVKLPGVTNAWVQPIKTRIDMLSTGVKTPVGIRISGEDIATLERIGKDIEGTLAQLDGTASVYAERSRSGRYIDIVPNRIEAAKYGLMVSDIQDVIKYALGGANVAKVIDGRMRFPINLRYPRYFRDDIESLKTLPFLSPTGAWVTLSQVADISIKDGPAIIKSENGAINTWVYINLKPQTSISEYIEEARAVLRENVELPAKYTYSFAGEFEHIERLTEKLTTIIPLTLVIIFVLLYMIFQSTKQALLVILTLPIAVSGSFWFVYWLGYSMSGTLAIGMIALCGVAAEFGVVIIIYLNQALKENQSTVEAVRQGALLRIRPKVMTVCTIVIGLLPIMLSSGAGNQIMQQIAAPMIGGMILSPVMSMLVIPAAYLLIYREQYNKGQQPLTCN